MKKNLLLSTAFVLLFTFIQAQPNLIGICSQGATQFGSIINYTVGDTTLSNVYKLEGNPGKGLMQNGMTEIGGKFYGCLSSGGAHSLNGNSGGIIFEYDPLTNIYTSIYDFLPSTGSLPYCDLLLASNGLCYGTTSYGGVNNCGVIFEFNIATRTYTKIYDMSNPLGNNCQSTLIQATNGKLYGLTTNGGTTGFGVLFEFDYITHNYAVKFSFDGPQGKFPNDRLLQASNGKLYGTTRNGGSADQGVIFEYDIASGTYSNKIDFIYPTGINPLGGLIQATNGKLYGTTEDGGANGYGSIFEYDYTTNLFITKHSFNQNITSYGPLSRLLQASNGKLYGITSESHNSNVLYAGNFFEFNIITNIFTELFSLNNLNAGQLSYGSPVIQASNGKIYGCLERGGNSGCGVIFQYDLNTNTVQKKVDLFDAPNGANPDGSLLLASNGKFYGLTGRQQYNYGELFEYDYHANIYTKKATFNNNIGFDPSGTLMEASNGKLYGTTQEGGNNYSSGTLFEYDFSTNTLTKKIDFVQLDFYACGKLIEAGNGKLYGLATGSTVNYPNYGSLYEYDLSNNSISFIHPFVFTEGCVPYGSLVEATNGKLYGMTSSGADSLGGSIFEFDYSTHVLTKLHSFISNTEGSSPDGSLIEVSNGKLYGMTKFGGANNAGTIFEFDYNSNTFTKKTDLSLAEGSNPLGSLMKASNGKLYGMTFSGGLYNDGVVFEYDYINNTYIKQIDLNAPLTGSRPANSSLLEVSCVSPAITASGPTSFCQGGSVTLNATSTSTGTYQWKRNGNVIAGAINQSLLVTNRGKYTVTVMDSLCNNSLTSSATKISIPCIPPIDPQEKIHSENNSATSEFSLLFDAGTDILTVQAVNIKENNFNISIFDYTGKLIFSENGSSQNSEIFRQINCASFPGGLFIAKFSTPEEQQVKKFVKN